MRFVLLLWGFVVVWAQELQEIEKALFNQDLEKARNLIQQRLTQNPKDAYAYYLWGRSYVVEALEVLQGEEADTQLALQLLQSAEEKFRLGIRKSPKLAYNYAGLGWVAILRDNLQTDKNDRTYYDQAKSHFQKALEYARNDVKLLLTIADAYHQSKRLEAVEQATPLLTRARERDKNNPEVFIRLGDNWKRQFVPDLAIQHYKEALKLDPSNVEAHYALGKLYLRQKKYNEAAKEFAEAIKLDPNFAPAYPELGELFYKIKRYKDAKAYYEKYVQLRPNDLRAKVRYAKFLYLSQDYKNAVKTIQEVLKDTTSLVLQRLLGYSLYEVGQYEQAKAAMDKFFQQAPERRIIGKDYFYYAKILHALNDLEGAEKYYKKALEKEPENRDYWITLADFYRKNKRYADAVPCYQKALQIKGDLKTYFIAGRCCAAIDSLHQADSIFAIITEKWPTWLQGYLERARIHAKWDPETEKGLAKPFYEKVVELGLKDSVKYKKQLKEAYTYLGYYYYNAEKDYEKALEYYKKLAAIDPENEVAKEMIPYLEKQIAYQKQRGSR